VASKSSHYLYCETANFNIISYDKLHHNCHSTTALSYVRAGLLVSSQNQENVSCRTHLAIQIHLPRFLQSLQSLSSVVMNHTKYSTWTGSCIVRWHYTQLYSVTNKAPLLGTYGTTECTKLLPSTFGPRITGHMRSPMPNSQDHNIRTEVTVNQSVEKPTAIQKVSCYTCSGSESVRLEFLRRGSVDTRL
jgi:hypothetical protein